MRRVASLIAVLAVASLGTGTAHAHGDLQGTSPADGSSVGKPPREIRITLTEAPTKGAEAKVVDGCKDSAPGSVAVDGSDIVISLTGGEPGRWKVSYRAVSSVDGHQTKGKFDFRVSGKKDCTQETPGDQVDAGDDPGIVQNPDPPDESGTSWLLWVGGGTVLLAAAAFFVRRSTQ